jgi:hypothetical protein
MLWRYDMRYGQTQQDIGTGLQDSYGGVPNALVVDKSAAAVDVANQQPGPVLGRETGRQERAAGKTGFKQATGVQL